MKIFNKSSLKNSLYGVVLILIVCLLVIMRQERKEHEEEVQKLHNELALNAETIEVHKNAFSRKSLELENLSDVMKQFELMSERDSETIKSLRKKIRKNNEDILNSNRVALKWKEAYEAVADAQQSEIEEDDVPRKKVDFQKDFGYISVNGYTLTDPAYAYVKVQQLRPLTMTLTMTQSKDGSWNTYTTSSEDNIEFDIKVSAVNPFMLEEKWYEKLSVDAGLDLKFRPAAYIGLSYPLGPLSLSGGFFSNEKDVDWYATASYSFKPFSSK